MQHILELGNEHFSDTICRHLKGKYVMLSQLQCGSFVVEKCLRASKLGLRYFVEDISHNEGKLRKLAHDKFGNYVIQTALEISKEVILAGTRIFFLPTNMVLTLFGLVFFFFFHSMANTLNEFRNLFSVTFWEAKHF